MFRVWRISQIVLSMVINFILIWQKKPQQLNVKNTTDELVYVKVRCFLLIFKQQDIANYNLNKDHFKLFDRFYQFTPFNKIVNNF